MNLKNYTTAQLLTAFNAHTSRDLKKFESRQIAEVRVGALIRDGGLNIDAVLAEHGALAAPAEIEDQAVAPAAIETIPELTDDEVPGFLRRSSPMPAIEVVNPPSKSAEELAFEAKYAEFIAIVGDADRDTDAAMTAAFSLAVEFGKSLIPTKAPRAKVERKPRAEGPTKREQAAALLLRPEGATTKDILETTGWPSVSVPQLARSSKLTLRQEKDGKVTRYYAEAA